MTDTLPRNTVGPPVRGEDFFDREREQARIWRDLETDHLLLLAPRRVGKTSLMLRLCETAECHDFQAVYATVADVRDELEFVRRLYKVVLEGNPGGNILRRLQGSAVARFFRRLSPSRVSAGPVVVEFTV